MSGPSDKDPPASPPDADAGDEAADVVSLDEARQARAQKEAAAGPGNVQTVDAGEVLQPIMTAIAKELSGLADKDGVVRLTGDEASKEKTAAVLRGIGAGLGAVLGEAFGKWASKLAESGTFQVQTSQTPPGATPTPPAGGPGGPSPAAGPPPSPTSDDDKSS